MTIDACDHIVEISYSMVIEHIEMFYGKKFYSMAIDACDHVTDMFYSMAIDACDTSRKFPILW